MAKDLPALKHMGRPASIHRKDTTVYNSYFTSHITNDVKSAEKQCAILVRVSAVGVLM